MKKSSANRYSPEVRNRAVRMVFEHQNEHDSQWSTIRSIAEKIGCAADTLRAWVRQAERDEGVQYVSIRYTERLTEADIDPSVGSVGDSYDCEDCVANSEMLFAVVALSGLTLLTIDFVSLR
ncbi:MAG: hypothetical protein ACI8PT_001722 [Gammaproteobacteria bacterium]|jgi:hypothetical protein